MERGHEIESLDSRKAVLRIGSVVQEQGRLSDATFSEALAAVGQLAAYAKQLGVEKLLTVGTSALREARNDNAFCEACRAHWGVDVELLSGDEEARLAYAGARSALGIASVSSTQMIKLCDTLALMGCGALMARGVGRNRAMTLATGAAVIAGAVAGFGHRELRISPRCSPSMLSPSSCSGHGTIASTATCSCSRD